MSGLPVLTTDVCGYAYYVADEGMGVVDASPFDQSSFNKNLTSLLCEPRDIWFDKGRRFAETADIYDLSNPRSGAAGRIYVAELDISNRYCRDGL